MRRKIIVKSSSSRSLQSGSPGRHPNLKVKKRIKSWTQVTCFFWQKLQKLTMKIPLEEKKTPLELLSIAPSIFFYLPLKITKLFIFRRRQHFPPFRFSFGLKNFANFFFTFFLRKIKILNNGEHSLFGWNGRRLAGRESMCSQFFRDASRKAPRSE